MIFIFAGKVVFLIKNYYYEKRKCIIYWADCHAVIIIL